MTDLLMPLAALVFTGNGAIDLLINIGIIAIVAIVIKAVIEAFGFTIPGVVWIVLGGIAGILLLIFFAGLLKGMF